MSHATSDTTTPPPTAATTADGAPQVRVALGQRARAVERQSTAAVRFNDRDQGVVIFEDGPVALAYADPAHAVVLPPGRYLRLEQAAGRVYFASTSPQLDVLDVAGTIALADSIGRLLEGAGWVRDPAEGLGAARAVAAAARDLDRPGTGTTHVATWHLARGTAAWAAVPPDPKPYRGLHDGVTAVLSVRPMKQRSIATGTPQLLLTLELDDRALGRTLLAMRRARQARFGGAAQTLSSWEQQPDEPILPTTPR